MMEYVLAQLLRQVYLKGIQDGKVQEQQKILSACENGNPIEIDGRAFFIKSDLQNLIDIFADLEADMI